MFKAIFLFSFSAGRSTEFHLEVDAIPIRATEESVQQMKLTFSIGRSGTATTPLHAGFLTNYHPWSESPLALLLRALHLLRVEWFASISQELLSRPVMDLSLSVVQLTGDGTPGPDLASLSLKKIGHDDGYTLTQSLPNRSLFPMRIDAESAVPLGAALKALSQVQLEAVDLHTFPTAVQVPELTDGSGRRHVLREQIPHFALTAFDAYSAAFASNNEDSAAASLRSESMLPADVWANFLAA